jgi:hypothetical protein
MGARSKRGRAVENAPTERILVPSLRALGGFKFLEIAGAVTTILVAVAALLSHEHDLGARILIWWYAVLTTATLLYMYFYQRRHGRRIRFAAMLPSIHQVHHRLRDAASAIVQREAPLQETRPIVIDALTSIAQVFTGMTGARFRACVKEVTWPASAATPVQSADDLRDLQVSTFCRDGATGARPGDTKAAYVNQNTHFEVLFLHRDKYHWFASNNLRDEDHYNNSNWSADPKDDNHDYESTCVWPIQKQDDSGSECHDTVAFLCVDTLETGRINKRFDFWVGAAFADALYTVMKLLREQRAEAEREAAEQGLTVNPSPDNKDASRAT